MVALGLVAVLNLVCMLEGFVVVQGLAHTLEDLVYALKDLVNELEDVVVVEG